MSKKFKRVILILPIMIFFSMTFNFKKKSIVDNRHTHYNHDSLINIYKHSHSNDNIDSHYHSSKNISVLDYFFFTNENISLDIQENNKPLELITFYLNEFKNSFFKPPQFS